MIVVIVAAAGEISINGRSAEVSMLKSKGQKAFMLWESG
jgi:hypothetical protein